MKSKGERGKKRKEEKCSLFFVDGGGGRDRRMVCKCLA
jgi:hypothetical protein